MLASDKIGFLRMLNLPKKIERAEVAVFDPTLTAFYLFQQLRKKRAFAGVAIFARNHVFDQFRLWIPNRQGMSKVMI